MEEGTPLVHSFEFKKSQSWFFKNKWSQGNDKYIQWRNIGSNDCGEEKRKGESDKGWQSSSNHNSDSA